MPDREREHGITRESIAELVQTLRVRISAHESIVTPPKDVRRVARRVSGTVQENPIAAALGAVAVGFLAGLAIPATRVESERLGRVADQVRDQARHAGRHALAQGKEVARETAQTALRAVQEGSPDA